MCMNIFRVWLWSFDFNITLFGGYVMRWEYPQSAHGCQNNIFLFGVKCKQWDDNIRDKAILNFFINFIKKKKCYKLKFIYL